MNNFESKEQESEQNSKNRTHLKEADAVSRSERKRSAKLPKKYT